MSRRSIPAGGHSTLRINRCQANHERWGEWAPNKYWGSPYVSAGLPGIVDDGQAVGVEGETEHMPGMADGRPVPRAAAGTIEHPLVVPRLRLLSMDGWAAALLLALNGERVGIASI
ncbi:hypothetical protein BD779DRAFT_1469471 [Infundibulicybe gibba]|nr:hypothetical protein BD779DRAFT_1469471 [Infundibulicybe gibba]